MADETPGTTPAPAAVAPPAAAPAAVAAPPAAPPIQTHAPVPYERFAERTADYRSAQVELAAANVKLNGFEGWMSPTDHEAAIKVAVGKSARSGNLAALLAGSGVEISSRAGRFLTGEFEGVEEDGWEAKLTELRESDPAFFGTGSNGTPKATPRTNPDDRARVETTDSGRAAGLAALKAAQADRTYYTDPKVRERILADLNVQH